MSALHRRLSHAGFAALVGIVLCVGAGVATADDRDPFAGSAPVAITIHVSKADLASSDAAKALAIRIRAAASTVCGGDVLPVVRTSEVFASCREAAIARAVGQLNDPALAHALGHASQQLASERR